MGQYCLSGVAARIPSHMLSNLESNQDLQNQNLT